MALKLYTFPQNFRAWKIQIAAEYAGVEIEVPKFDFPKENHSEEFKRRHHPLGKVPALETPHGSLFESGAILRYIARLRPDTNLFGSDHWRQARVEQYLEFCNNELEAPRSIWLYPILGYMMFDETAYAGAKNDVGNVLQVLDNHLLNHTFLVGHAVSLADISFVCALHGLYTTVFSPEYAAQYPNVLRWFNTCVHQPQFEKIIGEVKFATEEKKAPRSAGGAAGAKGKDGGAKKDGAAKGKDAGAGSRPDAGKKDAGKKDAGRKDEGKKDAGKDTGKKDAGKKDGGKKDGGKKDGGKSEGKAAKKASESEDLEDAAAAEEAAKAKRKNPLDALPPTTMVLDAVKKLFFSQRPFNPAFWGEFWKIYDNNGYSFWKCESKDLIKEEHWRVCNLMNGFLQRAEDCRKYAFGVLTITGKDEETQPYNISGGWLFRGPQIIQEMKECPDSDSYTFSRIDVTTDAGKAAVQAIYCGDTQAGARVLERKYFK
jgi:elongation factor 1-gamma